MGVRRAVRIVMIEEVAEGSGLRESEDWHRLGFCISVG